MRRWHILLLLKALLVTGLLFAQTAAYAHTAEYHHDHHHGHAHESDHDDHREHNEHDSADCDIQILATEDQYILPAPPPSLRFNKAPARTVIALGSTPLYLKAPARGPPVRGPPLSHS